MMSKKSPQLRFEGFTNDWEERKLSEVADIMDGDRGKNYPNGDDFSETGHTLFMSATNVTKNGFKFDETQYISEEKSDSLGNGKIIEDDLILTSRGTVGNLALYDADAKRQIPFARINSGMLILRKKQNESAEFVLQYLKSLVGIKQLNLISFGSAQSQITKKDISKYKVQIPNFDEQTKIGTFFKQLDTLITLHQRKLDLLKEQKKGYLQKMFPKNGANVPELRFAGFADDWEERKLSDVANHRGGTAIEKYFDKDGEYKVISIGSYGLNSQYVDQNIRAISNEITDGRVVNSGELTMVLNDKTANGTIIGRTLLVEKDNEYVINQRTEIISPKENFDSNFAYTILNGPFREKVKRIVQGGTQIYVNYPAVSNLNLELPKIEEQQKIGSFFKQLDDTIALHQRKLDLLKEQKKGFLQKMFV
ncbi:MAG: Restriction endonuclease subunit S [Lactococcus sp.]|jgi:type I restriction enzyme, S subunit